MPAAPAVRAGGAARRNAHARRRGAGAGAHEPCPNAPYPTLTQVLVYMSPACGALLLACAAVWERDALLPGKGLEIAARNPLGFAAALCMGFFVNLTTAYAIQMTSSLTFKARRPPPGARPGSACGRGCRPGRRQANGPLHARGRVLTQQAPLLRASDVLRAAVSALRMRSPHVGGCSSAARHVKRAQCCAHAVVSRPARQAASARTRGAGVRVHQEHGGGGAGRGHGRHRGARAAGRLRGQRVRLRAVHARKDAGGRRRGAAGAAACAQEGALGRAAARRRARTVPSWVECAG